MDKTNNSNIDIYTILTGVEGYKHFNDILIKAAEEYERIQNSNVIKNIVIEEYFETANKSNIIDKHTYQKATTK